MPCSRRAGHLLWHELVDSKQRGWYDICVKYMLIMYTSPEDTLKLSKEDIKNIEQKHKVLLDGLKQKNQIISGSGLLLPSETKTLHTGSDTIDGQLPVANARKQMTAYYVVECETEQDAFQIAKVILDDHVTDVEVRGIHNSVS